MAEYRPIAIYLPQFHPIPENDAWWGKGFTEWTNVRSAKPLLQNHNQPQLPSELGFYDLKDGNVFHEQIRLAREAGIYGFMFYEYWFSGKRLLEKPIENYLTDDSIDFPYFLCWANENWTRRWDGQDAEILMKQEYSEADFSNHFDQVFRRHILSKKYIKIKGKPVIAIYKPELIPNLQKLVSIWIEKTIELGFPGLYLLNCEASGDLIDPVLQGFDASYEFQPNWRIAFDYRIAANQLRSLESVKIISLLKNLSNRLLKLNKVKNTFLDYSSYSRDYRHNFNPGYKRYPCIMTSWDNSPRRKKGNATVFLGSSPELYLDWFKRLLSGFTPFSEEENFIFINAWNEWAEGAHLEPCQKWGKGYLEATRKALIG